MGHSKTDMTTRTSVAAGIQFPYSVLRSRWLLVIAVTAILAFGGRSLPGNAEYALAGAMIVSNVVLALLRSRGIRLTQALEVITVVDVLVVTVVVGWVDPSPETYAAISGSLILAFALGRVPVIMLLMVLVCGAYAGYLYMETGPGFWRQVDIILRVPFLFAVGLHFASITSYLKQEKARRDEIIATARQKTNRAEHLVKGQDRLQALSQIGRLALTSADSHPVKVLLEMTRRAQRTLGASQCTLVVFPQSPHGEGWSGRTKDRKTTVRTLSVGPDTLSAILPEGKLDELHPGDNKDLMEKVKVFFPDSNPFGSLLVAPITADGGVLGALFLIDDHNERTYSAGERDFFGTVSLMTGAFIQARKKLEDEVQLRALITNAPVIMFALTRDGTITLFEGRGAAVLKDAPAERIGKSLFDLSENPEQTKEAFEKALGGDLAAGTLLLEGILFETQYSPLRGVDGKISGVMGVTTAILDTPAPQPPPSAAPAQSSGPAASAEPSQPTAPAETSAPAAAGQPSLPAAEAQPSEPAAPTVPAEQAEPHAAPEAAPTPPRRVFPTPPPGLKPLIPLADEDESS